MILREIKLKNICQHEDLAFELGPGLIGIFGHNGAGKSNFIQAIKASLTGEFGFGGRLKADQIRRGAGERESAFIDTLWDHGDTQIRIRRSLQRPVKNTLQIGAGEEVTNTQKLNQDLCQLLGVSEALLDEYVFVSQGSVDSFLTSKPAARKTHFAEICGAESLEQLRELLGDEVREISQGMADDRAATELRSIGDQLTQNIDELRDRVEKLRQQQLPPEQIAAANLTIKEYNAQAARRSLRERLETGIAKLRFSLQEEEPARPIAPQNTVTELNVTLSRRRQDYQAARNSLEQLTTEGRVNCPVCATPVAQLTEHIEAQRSACGRLPQTIAKLEKDISEAQRLESACRIYEQKMASWTARQKSNRDRLEELEAELAVLPSAEADVTAEEVKILEASLSRHVNNTARLAELERTVSLLQGQQRENQQLLLAAEEQQKQNERRRQWLERLESWRHVLHRDSLPRIYMTSVLEELVDRMNELLEEFGGPFRVSANDDLSFTVHNPDGSEEPATSKSGGERVVLAIAYRLAVNERFAAGIGFMVLDEPTAFLDEKNLDCLSQLLQRICEVLRQRRQQLLLVTHDQRLARVFARTITLG